MSGKEFYKNRWPSYIVDKKQLYCDIEFKKREYKNVKLYPDLDPEMEGANCYYTECIKGTIIYIIVEGEKDNLKGHPVQVLRRGQDEFSCFYNVSNVRYGIDIQKMAFDMSWDVMDEWTHLRAYTSRRQRRMYAEALQRILFPLLKAGLKHSF